jgi:hypothetical protein
MRWLYRAAPAALLLAISAWGGPALAGGKGGRFGIEGDVVRYDTARKVLVVRVVSTEVAGRFASGNTVGGRAPDEIKRGQEAEFAVEPEGSVLRRTVVKAQTGGGLDTSGTAAGFQKALARIPADRPAVMSLGDNDAQSVAAGAPKYKILMIQIPYTLEELQQHFDKISTEE